MEKKYELFHKTISALESQGILEELILIGSWCLYFYRILFDNDPKVPVIRTLDIDFLIPNPPKINKSADVPGILLSIGFLEELSSGGGYSKFVHPELEIEFLIPEKGRGKEGPYHIREFNINAQGLRYVNLLQQYTREVKFENLTIVVPEPSAFVLHKIHLSLKRKIMAKKEKDIETAVELGEYLLSIPEEKEKLSAIFHKLPGKWQKEIRNGIQGHSAQLADILD